MFEVGWVLGRRDREFAGRRGWLSVWVRSRVRVSVGGQMDIRILDCGGRCNCGLGKGWVRCTLFNLQYCWDCQQSLHLDCLH